ncbi:MAG: hypothetical protein AB7I19_12230 [Planctomycetota bacterium]
MGRTNWILAGLGLLACVMLTIMMQQAMRIRNDRLVDPLAAAVSKTFGSRLDGPTRWKIRSVASKRTGTLELQPTVGVDYHALARDVGDFVWQQVNRKIADLIVICDSGVGTPAAFAVPPPWDVRRPIVRIELPTPAAPPAGK